MQYRLKSLKDFGNAIKLWAESSDSFAPFVATDKSNLLESTTKYFVQDLIGEGPIAGLVDPKGNELVLFDQGVNNSEIFKGIYYNDYPVKNFFTDQFNYNRLEVYGRSGTEFQTYLPVKGFAGFNFSNPGVSYSIDKILYGIKDTISINFTKTARHVSALQLVKGGAPVSTIGTQQAFDASKLFNESNFEQAFGAYHEIKDPSTDYLFLSLKVNALYTVGGNGSTGSNSCLFGIEIGYKLNPLYKCYVLHAVNGIATSPYAFDLFFDVSDFDFALGPYIKVYNLSKANDPTNFNNNRSIGTSYVTEVTSLEFKYPNSCYFLSVFDGRGFSQPPNRTYDLKLLKIKVPENYDAEGKYYDGFWNGEFDSILRWTDNPAWIIYDLITNYRYGLGKFTFQESLADKWNLYRIAKYCDESVPTNNVSRFPPVNILSLHAAATGTPAGPSGSVSDAKDNVKNIIRLSHSSSMNGFFKVGAKLDLVSLKFLDTDEDGQQISVFKSFRVIITSFKFEDPATQTCAQIGFIPEFGLHKIFSKFPGIKEEINAMLGGDSGETKLYEKAMEILINRFTAAAALSPNDPFFNFINYIKNLPVFPDLEYVYNSGKAATQFPGFFPLTEPRFRANISLITETDVINLLNNVASTFKGLTYWSNNFVNFDNDRPKPSCYFFTNSNVKDGIFNYIGSSKDTRYTVAKIVYADETDGFKDKTIYVEDQINIRRYGYVEKEILGFGITSKSQARRIGEWFLITNQIEKELVIFAAGPEALLLSPGNVISITDELKVSGRKGGRVVSIVNNIIVLDDKYDFIQGGDILSFIIPTESITPSYLNKKSNEGKEISDSEIDKLNAVYLYKFEVEGTGLDGNFRTQITLKTTGLTEAEQNILLSIAPSTLWVYDKDDSNPSVAYSKQYRILGIKEKSQVEFEITAAEYEVTKFNYIENKQNLSTNNLYSENTSNITQIIPKNQVADIDVLNPQSPYVSITSQTFNIDDRYDYIIPSFDYSDNQYSSIVSVLEIKNGKLFNDFKDVNNTGSTACVGLVIEYVLNSKKISYVWRIGDSTSTTIARPINEVSVSFESLRVYKIGVNNEFLN